MAEKIIWAQEKEESEQKRQEANILEIVGKIKEKGVSIGSGRTAEVWAGGRCPDICVKMLANKEISRNRSHEEMRMMERALAVGTPVPEPVCSFETEEGDDYLFMERIRGCSLRDLVEQDLIDILPDNFHFQESFAKLRADVKKMHDEARLYHRDLHWGNVMLDKRGLIVIDFGDALVQRLASEDPYRVSNAKGELVVYTKDEDRITEMYRQVGGYLKERGFFHNKKGK